MRMPKMIVGVMVCVMGALLILKKSLEKRVGLPVFQSGLSGQVFGGVNVGLRVKVIVRLLNVISYNKVMSQTPRIHVRHLQPYLNLNRVLPAQLPLLLHLPLP